MSDSPDNNDRRSARASRRLRLLAAGAAVGLAAAGIFAAGAERDGIFTSSGIFSTQSSSSEGIFAAGIFGANSNGIFTSDGGIFTAD